MKTQKVAEAIVLFFNSMSTQFFADDRAAIFRGPACAVAQDITDLIGYWPANAGSGSLVANVVNAASNGTLNNGSVDGDTLASIRTKNFQIAACRENFRLCLQPLRAKSHVWEEGVTHRHETEVKRAVENCSNRDPIGPHP